MSFPWEVVIGWRANLCLVCKNKVCYKSFQSFFEYTDTETSPEPNYAQPKRGRMAKYRG